MAVLLPAPSVLTWGYELVELEASTSTPKCQGVGCAAPAHRHVTYVVGDRAVAQRWLCATHAPLRPALYRAVAA